MQRLKKSEFLEYWAALEERPIEPRPVPYKHEGSTYSQDGIRITGRREFIDAVLARLKDLLRFENAETRLQVVYQQATHKETRTLLPSWTCYIQVHERGHEAQMANAFLGLARVSSTDE